MESQLQSSYLLPLISKSYFLDFLREKDTLFADTARNVSEPTKYVGNVYLSPHWLFISASSGLRVQMLAQKQHEHFRIMNALTKSI